MAELDFRGLNDRLLGRAQDLVKTWLPGGSMRGSEYVCGSIMGGKGESFSVNVTTGMWGEFAGTMKGGDLVSLYAALEGISQGTAFKRLAKDNDFYVPDTAPVKQTGPAPTRITMPPDDAPAPPLVGCSMSWRYVDADGQTMFYVARYEETGGKQIRPLSWDATTNRWVFKGYPEPRPLYGLNLLADRPNHPVLLVEGEKAADAARKIAGHLYNVLTWPNGAQAFNKADWRPLDGKKLLLWPDADEPGVKAMQAIAEILVSRTKEIKIIDVSGRPDGWDAADAWAQEMDWDRVRTWAAERITVYPVPVAPVLEPERPPEPAVVIQAAAEAVSSTGDSAKAAVQVSVNMDEGEPEGVREAHKAMWENLGLQASTRGGATANLDNVLRVLQNYEYLKDIAWWDEFHKKYFTNWNLTTWEIESHEHEWNEMDTLRLTAFLQRQIGMTKISEGMVYNAIRIKAHEHERNEPKAWLQGLTWDGEPRIEAFFPYAFGVETSNYSLAASKNFWISMVARLMDPGCQVDNMIILEGEQGSFKSSALRLIGGKWGMECRDNILKKDFDLGLRGRSLVIINEWDKFRKAEAPALKDVISTPIDSVRPLFEKSHVDYKRTCIFIATTNKTAYLLDPTGARRYWPLRTKRIDKDWISANREQCFAEAVHCYLAGEKWWIMPIADTEFEQEKRRVHDEWESIISAYLVGLDAVTITDVSRDCIGLHIMNVDRKTQNRIGDCLRALGWENEPERLDGGKPIRVYRKRREDAVS